jgi:hypothetical protein
MCIVPSFGTEISSARIYIAKTESLSPFVGIGVDMMSCKFHVNRSINTEITLHPELKYDCHHRFSRNLGLFDFCRELLSRIS